VDWTPRRVREIGEKGIGEGGSCNQRGWLAIYVDELEFEFSLGGEDGLYQR
jgi:hypothetical protein